MHYHRDDFTLLKCECFFDFLMLLYCKVPIKTFPCVLQLFYMVKCLFFSKDVFVLLDSPP